MIYRRDELKESAIKKYGGDLAYSALAGFYTSWTEMLLNQVTEEIREGFRASVDKHIFEFKQGETR